MCLIKNEVKGASPSHVARFADATMPLGRDESKAACSLSHHDVQSVIDVLTQSCMIWYLRR